MTAGDEDDLFETAQVAATEPAPRRPLGPQGERFAAMDVGELAALWRRLQRVGLRGRSHDDFELGQLFNRLPHENPQRTLALVLEVLAGEPDKRVRMELNDSLMTSLIHRHGETLIEELEAVAAESAAFRWLLGGVFSWAQGDAKARLAAVADKAGWDADYEEARRPERKIDYSVLTVQELARAWVEQHGKPGKDRDDNWFALMDHEHDLAASDPEKLIDVALRLLETESDQNLLSLYAAGPLEDAIGRATIDRIEREAAANAGFATMLGGVYYFSEPDDIKARLDAILRPIGGSA